MKFCCGVANNWISVIILKMSFEILMSTDDYYVYIICRYALDHCNLMEIWDELFNF